MKNEKSQSALVGSQHYSTALSENYVASYYCITFAVINWKQELRDKEPERRPPADFNKQGKYTSEDLDKYSSLPFLCIISCLKFCS